MFCFPNCLAVIFRCKNRYTHANRTCPNHPYHKPHRSNDLILQPSPGGESDENVRRWLENYRRERMDKTPGKATSEQVLAPLSSNNFQQQNQQLKSLSPKRPKSKRGLATELEQENVPHDLSNKKSPPTSSDPPRILQSLNPIPILSSPIRRSLPRSPMKPCWLKNATPPSAEKSRSLLEERLILTPPKRKGDVVSISVPKKRWLKEAFREQTGSSPSSSSSSSAFCEDLARPIKWSAEDEEDRHRRSPKSMIVAKALMELSDNAAAASKDQSQPLNLSIK